jgi:hypothetical protein
MPVQYWTSLLNQGVPWQTNVGTALSTATTATISPQAATTKDFAVPANYLYAGSTLRIYARGFITTTTTSTTWTMFLGTNINNAGTYVTLATTAGITTGTTAATGLPWWLTAIMTCTAVGSTGNTVVTQGTLFVQSTAAQPALSGTSNILHFGLPAASGLTSAAVDTTSPQGIGLRATLAGANATVQCTNFDIEAMA